MLHKIKIQKNQLLISYKLLADGLFIALTFLLLALLAEGVLPGIITSHIGFSKIITVIGSLLLASYLIAKTAKISFSREKINKKTAYLLLFLLLLLLFNGLIKLNIFLNLFILTTTAIAAYFIYKVIFEENE